MARYRVGISSTGSFDAGGCQWRAIDFPDGMPAGKWIALRYRRSLYDKLERPVLRLTGADGANQQSMPVALFGTAEWIGFIPEDTTSLAISTTAKAAAWTSIALTSCDSLNLGEIFYRGFSRDPLATLFAAVVAVSHGRTAFRRQISISLGSTPMHRYHRWRADRTDLPNPSDLDAPRSGWSSGPRIHVLVRGAGRTGITGESLARQTYPHWSASQVTETVQDEEAAFLAAAEDGDLVVPLVEGDCLPPAAFAVLAEYAMAHPDVGLMYADEDARDASGRFCEPLLKPDWSPVFHQRSFYPGNALYFRVSALRNRTNLRLRDVVEPGALWSAMAEGGTRAGHVRGVLLTIDSKSRRAQQASIPRVTVPPEPGDASDVSIIIPSKDRAKLLDACMSSLAMTAPGRPEIIVVDNGSQEEATQALYRRMRSDNRLRVRVLDAPGPFNFSRLCNMAAATANGRTLVFLNNDTVVTQSDWLGRLLKWTARPDIGAVGARLLYPNGRVQHAGIVTGMLGYASHFELDAPGGDRGYLNSLSVPREVSAVTGACLAVEKAKFDRANGFDIERFPIELGDVDLCLRLNALGYRTIVAMDAVLIHAESATRGRPGLFEVRYRKEKEHFASLWASAIRDDPFFHPAFSLTSKRLRLDG